MTPAPPHPLAGLALAAWVMAGPAAAAEPSHELAALDQVGRAIATEKCQRPAEIKTQFVMQPLAADATDEMQSHACRGFRVAVYLSTRGDATREFPMSVVVESAHPRLAGEWSVGAAAASVRSRLGTPYISNGESFGYSLRADRPGKDVVTFEVERGVVRAVTWNWDID